MTPVSVIQGDTPLVLGMPHTGTWLPDDISQHLTPLGRTLSDTDWHIDRLYDDLTPGVSVVRANFHRYAIDANRDPSGKSLYPGQATTDLVPTTDFDNQPLWHHQPMPDDIQHRLIRYHAHYHAALQAELTRVHARHGIAILYDCHSIRSRIPHLFADVLPDFNIGTNDGRTCAPAIQDVVSQACQAAGDYSSVLNGRFKGGWTTRHYGRPETGIHAIQMELAQSTYLTAESAPWTYDNIRAERLRVHLTAIVEGLIRIAPQLKGAS